MLERREVVPPSIEQPSLKTRILNACAEIGIADRIGQKRAVDIVEKSKVGEHLKNGGIYCDLGTGLGHIVERMVREDTGKSVKFVAVEPVWRPLKKVRQRLGQESTPSKALFVKAVGQALPIADKSVDGVSIFFVLHHADPEIREKIFSEVDRILKGEGNLFLIEDTPDNDEEKERNARWDRRLNFESKDEKHYYFTDSEWQKFLGEHGFEIIDSAYFEDVSPKKNEGTIRHKSYILRRKKQTAL